MVFYFTTSVNGVDSFMNKSHTLAAPAIEDVTSFALSIIEDDLEVDVVWVNGRLNCWHVAVAANRDFVMACKGPRYTWGRMIHCKIFILIGTRTAKINQQLPIMSAFVAN